ncbi:hypothetical protein EDB83DRAFT_122060 [Lactarius deliciosus]|nr:hypothetical protein EDB83DRAFT_122060 [Lactarius deliciosus]
MRRFTPQQSFARGAHLFSRARLRHLLQRRERVAPTSPSPLSSCGSGISSRSSLVPICILTTFKNSSPTWARNCKHVSSLVFSATSSISCNPHPRSLSSGAFDRWAAEKPGHWRAVSTASSASSSPPLCTHLLFFSTTLIPLPRLRLLPFLHCLFLVYLAGRWCRRVFATSDCRFKLR